MSARAQEVLAAHAASVAEHNARMRDASHATSHVPPLATAALANPTHSGTLHEYSGATTSGGRVKKTVKTNIRKSPVSSRQHAGVPKLIQTARMVAKLKQKLTRLQAEERDIQLSRATRELGNSRYPRDAVDLTLFDRVSERCRALQQGIQDQIDKIQEVRESYSGMVAETKSSNAQEAADALEALRDEVDEMNKSLPLDVERVLATADEFLNRNKRK
jgi:hypothetical protein